MKPLYFFVYHGHLIMVSKKLLPGWRKIAPSLKKRFGARVVSYPTIARKLKNSPHGSVCFGRIGLEICLFYFDTFENPTLIDILTAISNQSGRWDDL